MSEILGFRIIILHQIQVGFQAARIVGDARHYKFEDQLPSNLIFINRSHFWLV